MTSNIDWSGNSRPEYVFKLDDDAYVNLAAMWRAIREAKRRWGRKKKGEEMAQ